MAIAYDSSSIGTQVNSNTLTWSHTCTGTDLILFVSCMVEFTDILTSVTYNGTAMTQLGKGRATSGRYTYLYMLVNPASGTHDVVMTASGTTFPQGISASYTGVKQTGQPDASNTNETTSGTSLTTSVTTTANGCWTVLADGNYGSNSVAGTGATLRNQTNGISLFDSNGAITPAGSTSLQTTFISGDRVQHIMASFAPTSYDSGTVTPTPTLAFMGAG